MYTVIHVYTFSAEAIAIIYCFFLSNDFLQLVLTKKQILCLDCGETQPCWEAYVTMRRGFLRFQARARGVLARNLLRSWLRAKVLGWTMGMMGWGIQDDVPPCFFARKGGGQYVRMCFLQFLYIYILYLFKEGSVFCS